MPNEIMGSPATPAPQTGRLRRAVRAVHPGWAISQSGTDGTSGYWAQLFGDPTPTQQAEGARAFISADSLEQLDDELERQDTIRRRNP